MKEFNDITTKEAIWLIISTINQAKQDNTEINIDEITSEYISNALQSHRAINNAYSDMKDAVLSGKENKFTEMVEKSIL